MLVSHALVMIENLQNYIMALFSLNILTTNMDICVDDPIATPNVMSCCYVNMRIQK
jgi:hypothetical protein